MFSIHLFLLDWFFDWMMPQVPDAGIILSPASAPPPITHDVVGEAPGAPPPYTLNSVPPPPAPAVASAAGGEEEGSSAVDAHGHVPLD
jgi:hypothetical protein